MFMKNDLIAKVLNTSKNPDIEELRAKKKEKEAKANSSIFEKTSNGRYNPLEEYEERNNNEFEKDNLYLPANITNMPAITMSILTVTVFSMK